jgi:hypothetical protein
MERFGECEEVVGGAVYLAAEASVRYRISSNDRRMMDGTVRRAAIHGFPEVPGGRRA